jgi:diaminopimelate epimerase
MTSMGNSHCLTFGDSPLNDWEELGREIEMNPPFPNRTNVEFVMVISQSDIAVPFWEREGAILCPQAPAPALRAWRAPSTA